MSEQETPRAFPVSLDLERSKYKEQKLAALIQASFEAGYKIEVDSPETLPGIEGLTDDHLIEISSGVYMKFKHAYVVGNADKQKVELIDPHGNTSGKDNFFYTKKLVDSIEKLYKQMDDLTKELEASNHQIFSIETRNNLNSTFTQLTTYMKDTPIEKVKNKWERLKNRKELREEGKNLTGLNPRAGVSFLEQINEIIPMIKQTDIGKGFWTRERESIAGEQKINYSALKEYFYSIRINKLG